jgi:hypothetical protein
LPRDGEDNDIADCFAQVEVGIDEGTYKGGYGQEETGKGKTSQLYAMIPI